MWQRSNAPLAAVQQDTHAAVRNPVCIMDASLPHSLSQNVAWYQVPIDMISWQHLQVVFKSSSGQAAGH